MRERAQPGYATQWQPYEITLQADRHYANPYLDLEVWGDVTGPDGQRHKVYGFWDGDRTWRVRFAPMQPGAWHFVTNASVDEAGRRGVAGAVTAVPPTA